MRYTILLFVLGLLIGSCKPDNSSGDAIVEVKDDGNTVITKADPDAPAFTPSNLPLPNACTLLSKSDIGRLMNIDGDDIEVKDGSAGSNHSRACFFKWVGDRPNAGILIQVQKNPVGDEFPEWATSFVESKRTMGESDFTGGSENYKYSDLDGLGDDGAYNYEMGKYFWRTGNDYVYMLAFNEDMSASKQLTLAKQFGKIIMDNVSK